MRLYIEFINVYANFILYWVFVRRKHADIVRKQMVMTSVYLPDQTNHLAIVWRSISPRYSPPSGVTPLMLIARNLQCDILKGLFQYGMPECERRPLYVVISILFHPSSLEETMQIAYGHTPLLKDWRLCIPTNRCQEPCELTHLCRVSVRARLLLTGGLPDAIKILPLPTYLQHYLNLKY
ncbi:ankyrin repeat and SOCS box protein 17 [Electrophorus electricus]|uniref:ankyrin repeat and SOCS box protein 17 n=1 Tax=Electrophorus electricus TaxID=8005 RepID=UPI0015CFBEF1|nr:ankyrin repeat and SOCS box protein 17 [Electrophorus electricus]